MTKSRVLIWGVMVVSTALIVPSEVLAHGGGISNPQPSRLVIPMWLFLLTGGAIIGVSFLLASFILDPKPIRYFQSWNCLFNSPRYSLVIGGKLAGLACMILVVFMGLFGPMDILQNGAIILVWVGWWAGFTMSVYLLGNTWPLMNPFYTLTEPFGDGRFEYPDWLQMWPATAGVLLLVWIETVSPVTKNPRVLATAIIGYLLITIVGVNLIGIGNWFRKIDPISGVFRQYGKVAPLHSTGRDIQLTLPGSTLITQPATDISEVGLIIALVWGTSFDGIIQTPLWGDLTRILVETGYPPAFLYPSVLLIGYLFFFTFYWVAIRRIRQFAPTCLRTATLAREFAPSLLAIAAAYHFAHYLSYFYSLSPALMKVFLGPILPWIPTTILPPEWTGSVAVVTVLGGHLLAVWVAHNIAFRRFPSRVQVIRSQYSITGVMVVFTIISLWIVTQPYSQPPYL